MVIGVLSDSHGNLELMHNALVLLDRCGVTRVYHLGDDYSDTERLVAEGRTVGRVPGIYGPEYKDPAVPNKLVETVDDIRIMFVHAEQDVTGADLSGSDIVCVGHTHIPELRDDVHHLMVNPGHLKGPTSKNQAPSCAVIETGAGRATVRIMGLDGTVIDEVSKDFRSRAVRNEPDDNKPGHRARNINRREQKERRKAERRRKREESLSRKQAERRRRERRERVRRRRDQAEPDLLRDDES
jgi:putative phosphoesterase